MLAGRTRPDLRNWLPPMRTNKKHRMIATIGKDNDFCERWIARSIRSDANAPFHIAPLDSTVADFLPGIQSFPGKITAAPRAGCLGSVLLRLAGLVAQEA
jgi:hypothetical protein